MLNLVAQGYGLEDFLARVTNMESTFEEGQNGRLVIETDRCFSPEELADLRDKIEQEGVTIFDVKQNDRVLVLDFQKNLVPLLLIGLIIGGIALLPIVVFSWRFFTQGPDAVMQSVLKYVVLPAGILTIAGFMIYMGLRKSPAVITQRGVSF